VGRLVAPQGLSGELRLLPLSDFPQRFTRPGRRWLQSRQTPARAIDLLHGRQLPGKELFVVRLAGIDSRMAAEAVVGAELLVPAADRLPLDPGEFHLLDLVGLQVRLLNDPGGGEAKAHPIIGSVTDLIHAGNDLLEVEPLDPTPADRPAGAQASARPRRLLIPFVEAIVPVVNLAEGWIGITPPPGLLDL
jgi:16S rRNA processing protein RimM